MDSNFHQQQFQEFRRLHHPKPQTNSLTRFRSAPSSYFANLIDVTGETVNNTGGATGGGGREERRDFPNARPLSPETENIFNRFMSSIGAENNNSTQKLNNIPENTAVQPDFATRVKQERDFKPQQLQLQSQQENYNNQSQMIYHNQSKPPLSNQHNSAVSSAMQNSFTTSSMEMAAMPQMNTGLGGGNNNNNSNLIRHNSSPAGFFANLNIDIGYGMMGAGGTSNYGSGNEGNVQINYSSGQPSTSGLIDQNSNVGGKITRMKSLDKGVFNNQKNDQNYGYPLTSWDDSTMLENFSSGDDNKIFTELISLENQILAICQSGEGKNRPSRLTHHLSLPKTLPEMLVTENFLQFQDTRPCITRAKRGCATHPRSIAERVRRTRISERMRKLQDLVPNMDKQTNTSDMLDLAVDYIKDLQKQVETLTDNRAQCTCSR